MIQLLQGVFSLWGLQLRNLSIPLFGCLQINWIEIDSLSIQLLIKAISSGADTLIPCLFSALLQSHSRKEEFLLRYWLSYLQPCQLSL